MSLFASTSSSAEAREEKAAAALQRFKEATQCTITRLAAEARGEKVGIELEGFEALRSTTVRPPDSFALGEDAATLNHSERATGHFLDSSLEATHGVDIDVVLERFRKAVQKACSPQASILPELESAQTAPATREQQAIVASDKVQNLRPAFQRTFPISHCLPPATLPPIPARLTAPSASSIKSSTRRHEISWRGEPNFYCWVNANSMYKLLQEALDHAA